MIQKIKIPTISLMWSEWIPWGEVPSLDINELPHKSGVYEVTNNLNTKKRLTIGKSNKLRRRVLFALVNGTAKHSSGIRIRENEDAEKLHVRWALTNHPNTCEEYLHLAYKGVYGILPKYTIIT